MAGPSGPAVVYSGRNDPGPGREVQKGLTFPVHRVAYRPHALRRFGGIPAIAGECRRLAVHLAGQGISLLFVSAKSSGFPCPVPQGMVHGPGTELGVSEGVADPVG